MMTGPTPPRTFRTRPPYGDARVWNEPNRETP